MSGWDGLIKDFLNGIFRSNITRTPTKRKYFIISKQGNTEYFILTIFFKISLNQLILKCLFAVIVISVNTAIFEYADTELWNLYNA